MAKKKIDPFIYYNVEATEDFTRAIVQNDKLLFGLIELPSAKELIPCKYAKMDKFSCGRAVVYMDGKYGAIDLEGNEVIPLIYKEMTSFYNDRAVVIRDGKSGMIDIYGNIVADFIYDEMRYLTDAKKGVVRMIKDGLHGVLDLNGNEIVPFIYDYCSVETEYLQNYYISATKDEKEALYDMKGNELFSLKYKNAKYKSGYIMVSDGCRKYGVLDLQGRILTPFEYYEFSKIDNERGFLAMRLESGTATVFYDFDGNELMHIPYDLYSLEDDGIYIKDFDKQTIGLYDYEGRILIPPIYEDLRHLGGKKYLAQERGRNVACILNLLEGKTSQLPYKLIERIHLPETANFFVVSSNNKYGVLNNELEVVVPIMYDQIEDSYHELLVVKLDGKMGVIDLKGIPVIPIEYDKIDSGMWCDSENFAIRKKSKYGCYNIPSGIETLFTSAYDWLRLYPEKGYVIRKKEKYGILDWSGNAIGISAEDSEQKPKKKKVPTPICPFTEVSYFSEGFAAVQIEGKWGYIDTKGNLIHPITLDFAYDFEDGHAKVRGGKGSYINTKGEYDGYFPPIPPIDIFREPKGEHGYIYKKYEGNKVGWVNYAGKEVIPCIYDSVNRYVRYISLNDENQYICVCLDNKYGVFTLRGKLILEVEHDRLFDSDGFWVSTIDNKQALFAEDGRRITPHKYDKIFTSKGGIITVVEDGKYGLINKEGNEVVPVMYDYIEISNQGNYAKLSLNGFSGMITSDGKEVCPMKYHSMGRINEEIGLVLVEHNFNYGYIDTKGNEVIPLKYGCSEEFIGEYACVRGFGGSPFNNHDGLINAKGEEVVPLQYSSIGNFVNKDMSIIEVSDGRNVGLFDLLNKKELIAPKYASVGKYSDGWLAVKSRGKWGFVDLDGNPLDYEWLKDKTK